MAKADPNQTTGNPARDVIADTIANVCSDGNCDIIRVASDVIMALGIAGYEIVPVVEDANIPLSLSGHAWWEDDPGSCGTCGAPFELVRPGKSQPTCACWDDQERQP